MNPAATTLLREGQEKFFAEPPDLEGALDRFLRVVRLRPGWVEGHHWLAPAYEGLGRTDDAEATYRTAVACDPADSRPHISLGHLMLKEARFDEAIQQLQRGLALKPHDAGADARLFLAEANEGAGRLSKARAEWTRGRGNERILPVLR